MSELMVTADFKYFNGEAYMHIDQVAEILHKQKKHVMRDIKVIASARQKFLCGKFDEISTRRMQDFPDFKDIFNIDGVVVLNTYANGKVKDVYLNKEICELLQLYSDFRYALAMYYRWKELEEKNKAFTEIGKMLAGVTLSATKMFPLWEDRKEFYRRCMKYGLIDYEAGRYIATRKGVDLNFCVERERDGVQWVEYDVPKVMKVMCA